jgi:hypothetical protein
MALHITINPFWQVLRSCFHVTSVCLQTCSPSYLQFIWYLNLLNSFALSLYDHGYNEWEMSKHMTYYFSWGYIRVNTYWHIEQRTLKTLCFLTYLKLTRFCDYILLNLKFSGECLVDLFLSTFSFGYCIVYPFSNYTIWLSLWYLQTFPIICVFFLSIFK